MRQMDISPGIHAESAERLNRHDRQGAGLPLTRQPGRAATGDEDEHMAIAETHKGKSVKAEVRRVIRASRQRVF